MCGTRPERLQEELFLTRQNLSRNQISTGRRTAAARAATQDLGDLVVMDSADGVVSARNPFDLENKTVTFTPDAAARSYSVSVREGGFDAVVAGSGRLLAGMRDDDTRLVALPFAFPFYGRQYTDVFVNSDGNLTFGSGDTATSERSLARITAGAPRIAGAFRDLDPSNFRSEGIRLSGDSRRVVVSWLRVPIFSEFSFASLQSFQIVLHIDGRIEVAFERMESLSFLTGISPGMLGGETSLVDLSASPPGFFTGTVAEKFGTVEELDLPIAAQRFFTSHPDAYDYLIFYNNFELPAGGTAIAFELTVRNEDRSGFGDVPVDEGLGFGSRKRLQAIINMGPLSQYPADPNATVPSRGFSGDTPLSILGHEVGHLFLAYASVRGESDDAKPMLGRANAHWAFTYNSDASLVEGNRIEDKGAGANPRFQTVSTAQGYSAIDQYLMGLRAPEETPPSFLVQDATVPANRAPQTGVGFNGERREVTVQDLIEVEGRRIPDDTVAQRRFRAAFILVTRANQQPPAAQIEQLDRYRREFEQYFANATGNRAEIETELVNLLELSTHPAAGVLENRQAPAEVRLAQPRTTPVTVLLRAQSLGGTVNIPQSVIIPAGRTSALFEIGGVRRGVAELFAEANGFAPASSRIQVAPADGAGLKLEVVSGDDQVTRGDGPLPEPVVVRVVDQNLLPYSGLRLTATNASGQAAEAVTGEEGAAAFFWTPGPGSANRLRLTAPTLSNLATTVGAIGTPLLNEMSAVNAASFEAGLSPGSLATIFGFNFTNTGPAQATTLPLPLTLGGVQVIVNGQAAPLLFVSREQINFLAPANVTGDRARVMIVGPLGPSNETTAVIERAQPGIFFDGDTGIAAARVPKTGLSLWQAPAAPGDAIEIYLTGLGPMRSSPTHPGVNEAILRVIARIDGQQVPVLFAGEAPGFAGLHQVNLILPQDLKTGTRTLEISADGVGSNLVGLIVR